MYIINADAFPQDKLFKTNGVIANWLIREKNIPLLGKSKTGEYCFSKTELLNEVVLTMPFYLKLTEMFS